VNELVLFCVIVISIFLGVLVFIKLQDLKNPVVLLMVFFTLPLTFNRMKLSGLQTYDWHQMTYYLLDSFLIIFTVLPSIYYLSKKKKFLHSDLSSKDIIYKLELLDTNWFYTLLTLVIVLQIVVNKFNCGFYFPAFNLAELANLNFKFHEISVRFFGFFVIAFWYFVLIISFIKYLSRRNVFLLVLIILATISPLFRLARVDIFSILFIQIAIVLKYKTVNWKLFFKTTIVLLIFLIVGIFAMWKRSIASDLSQNGISKIIQFNGYSGPMDIFAFLYSYFSLSFENINLFVVKNIEGFQLANGAFVLRPIFVGIFKIHYFYPEYPMHDYFGNLESYISDTAMVPTCIPEFCVDFGFILSIIPMLIYSMLLNFLYVYSSSNSIYSITYFGYLPSIFLSAFQNLFISPLIVYLVIFLFIFNFIMDKNVVNTNK